MPFSQVKPPCSVLLSAIQLSLLLFCAAAVAAGSAHAEGIGGFLDYAVSYSDSQGRSGGGETSKATSNNFSQRYGLSLDRSLFPLVRLNAGGLFEKNASDSSANGVTTSGESRNISPSLSLVLSNPFVPGALGYSKREQSSSAAGSASSTNVMENYNMRLGLRPEGLPALDAHFSRANAFDPQRSRQDTTSDNFILSSRYQPVPNLDLNYQGAFANGENRLTGQFSRNLSNTVSGSYSQQLFSDRVSLFTNGTLAGSESTTSSVKQGGLVYLSLAQAQGLFLKTPTADLPPKTVSIGQLSPLTGSTSESIVTPFGGTAPPAGTEINLGLDLGPAFVGDQTSFTTLFLAVDVTGGSGKIGDGYQKIISRLSWDVYTGSDGITWDRSSEGINSASIGFDPNVFEAGTVGLLLELPDSLRNRLVKAPNVEKPRFIKIVATPLQLTINDNVENKPVLKIVVTKIEALDRRPASQALEQKSSTTSGLWNFGGKVKLLEGASLPTVYYDGSYNTNFSRQGAGKSSSNFISNGLSAFYKMNQYVSANARLSRSDLKGTSGERSADYSYNVSLNTQFLRTLQQAFTYSGRSGVTGGKSSSSNSFFVTNSAALYRGISANLSGGVSLTTNANGSTGQNIVATYGTSISPHPTLNITGNLSGSVSKQSGGGTEATSARSGSGGMTASYSPFNSLSLSGAFNFTALQGSKPVITRNLGGNWSPFRDGELQFNFGYFETLNSTGDQVTRSVSPSLRWSFRGGCWIDLNYSWASTEQTALSSEAWESSSISSTLRLSF